VKEKAKKQSEDGSVAVWNLENFYGIVFVFP
jgi:hypothetical protein